MTQNMGTFDRTIRALAAVLIAVLYFTDRITGLTAIILGVVAVAFFATSLIGWCPLYAPFRISTRGRRPQQQTQA
jgi:hypothetical protein